MDERKTILDYSPETYERVRQALLHVATVLGDWMEQVTLIGGVVPSLLVPPNALPEGVDPTPVLRIWILDCNSLYSPMRGTLPFRNCCGRQAIALWRKRKTGSGVRPGAQILCWGQS